MAADQDPQFHNAESSQNSDLVTKNFNNEFRVCTGTPAVASSSKVIKLDEDNLSLDESL